jgi:hypothetical protein
MGSPKYERINQKILSIFYKLKKKEEVYPFGSASTAEMIKEELKKYEGSKGAIVLVNQSLYDLYNKGSLDRYTQEYLVNICMKICEEKSAKDIMRCFKIGWCKKKIYPPRLMENINPKKYRGGYRKVPYVYVLKDLNNFYKYNNDYSSEMF